MRARTKLPVIFVIVTIAVIGASQSVNHAASPQNAKSNRGKLVNQAPVYTEEDIKFSMDANHWSRQTAITVLEMASESAAIASAPKVSRRPTK